MYSSLTESKNHYKLKIIPNRFAMQFLKLYFSSFVTGTKFLERLDIVRLKNSIK